MPEDTKNGRKYDVLILGGGFAGVYCAKTVRKKIGKDPNIRIGIVAEENYMVFQPLLAEVVGASVSPRHVISPIRHLCRKVDVFKGIVEEINLPSRVVRVDTGPFSRRDEIGFDHLVLALGSVVNLSRVPGMPEHAFLLRNVGDAMRLRATIISRFEEANVQRNSSIKKRLLSFVVVGGGYSGVETAGQIIDLFASIHHYYNNIDRRDFRVSLVHSRDQLLPGLVVKLGDYCTQKLRSRGVDVILNQRVKSVTAHSVYLGSGEKIDTSTVISTVGNHPHPVVSRLCECSDLPLEKGRVATNSFLQVDEEKKIWAAGDCAVVPMETGNPAPDNAQFAMREGILLGKNLAAVLRGRKPAPFTFKGIGELASIGHRAAVANIFGYKFSGFFAWWLWRTIYLAKLPRFDRKLRVALDWTLDLFLPRDLNLLSPRYSAKLPEAYFEKGDPVFRAGEPAFSFYIVKSGRINMYENSNLIKSLGKGEHFGERALLHDRIWHFDAVAVEPTHLITISGAVFRQIVQSSGSFAQLVEHSAIQYRTLKEIEDVAGRIPEKIIGATAEDIMEREVAYFLPDTTFKELLRQVRDHPHSFYPILDEEKKLMGILNREDIFDFMKKDPVGESTLVREMPRSSLPAVPRELPVPEIIERLIRSGSSKLLVVDRDNRLVGIITLMDLLVAREEAERRQTEESLKQRP
ncbi:MAG: FAD-dependent oxidoreductase [Opitutales bacterium]